MTSALGLLLIPACSDDPGTGTISTGGKTASGGATAKGGETASTGGTSAGGTTSGGSSSGGSSNGGSHANGGTSAGGTAASGGSSTGGASSGGGRASGGATANGGSSTGGTTGAGGATAKGGTTGAGGATAKGGAASGGAASGGTASGGAGSGGTTGTGGSSTTTCKPMGWATRASRTGGAFAITGGGNAAPVTVTSFAELQSAASGTDAKVIYIDGTLGSGWSDRSGDRLEIGSNKTIVGLKAGTQLKAALHIDGSSNVIVRNIVINGPGSNDKQAWDNLTIEGGAKNVWIDHCEFWDGQDGNADTVKGADTVTYTWNIFGYKMANAHNLSCLIASSDNEPVSVGKLDVTFMFNHFRGVDQRAPRCRYGFIHVVNNLFTKDGMSSTYSVSAGLDCKVLTENNYFYQVNDPIYTGHNAGTSGHEVKNNKFDGTSGNQTGYGTAFTPPYEYSSLMVSPDQAKTMIEAKAGATLPSPTACD